MVKHLFDHARLPELCGLLFPWLQDLYKIPQSFDDIAYGFLEGPPSENVNMWWAAINCVKESLWTTRNVLVFNRVGVPKEKVLKSILNLLKGYILKDDIYKDRQQNLEKWKVLKYFPINF